MELPLARGGTATLITTGIEQATVESPIVSPPGSTLELQVVGALGLKVRSCKLVPDSEPKRYRIEGRWISLSRAQRDALGIPDPRA